MPDPKLVSFSSAVARMEELVMDVNINRLQEVVDKGPWLICRDDQATYAITFGMRGHKNCGRYRVSYALLLKLSLSSQSLSATTPTINIDLL